MGQVILNACFHVHAHYGLLRTRQSMAFTNSKAGWAQTKTCLKCVFFLTLGALKFRTIKKIKSQHSVNLLSSDLLPRNTIFHAKLG